MLPRLALCLTIISIIILNYNTTSSYKTLVDLKKQYQKVEMEQFSTSDVLVGKAMDFMYSNRTFMSLIARELWDVGSRAIDKIVDIKNKKLMALEGDSTRPRIREGAVKERRDYRPTKWVANSAMDVWYGNKSMIDIISREFADIMYKYTSRSVRATSLDPSSAAGSAGAGDRSAHAITLADIPFVELNFFNGLNETVRSVKILPSDLLPRRKKTL